MNLKMVIKSMNHNKVFVYETLLYFFLILNEIFVTKYIHN